MSKRRCAACGGEFSPRRQVRDQRYCSGEECQRERRRRWQQAKRQNDEDYRANQTQAQRRWAERHPSYWREYRRTHPQYTEGNRDQQRRRNQTRRGAAGGGPVDGIAKSDVWMAKTNGLSGTYRLVPVTAEGIAKMDAYTVKIALLSMD